MPSIRAANQNRKPAACVTVPANIMARMRLSIGDQVDFDMVEGSDVCVKMVVVFRKDDFKKGGAAYGKE